METSYYSLVSFLAVFTLAIISPGPNFILVVNSALGESRRHSLSTALGIATGSLLFALSGLFGLLLLMLSWPPLAKVLVYAGGGYLAWLGVTMLWNSWNRKPSRRRQVARSLTLTAAYRRGLITNLTNPKAWAFYLSLFTLVVAPDYPLSGKLLLALAMFLISLSWYVLVAILMTSKRTGTYLQAAQPPIQFLLGLALLYLSGRLLLPVFS